MNKPLKTVLIALLTFLMVITPFNLIQADNSLDETRKLLEKSLSLFEIDREITRLTELEAQTVITIRETELRIVDQQDEVIQTRQKAGRVIKAYYMGERNKLWLAALSMGSFTQALMMIEYVGLILQRDQEALRSYTASYQQLNDLKGTLIDTQTQLAQVKALFVSERERLLTIQKEVELELKKKPELVEQVNQVMLDWQLKGLPTFQKYFAALGETMSDIQELILDPKYVEFKGTTIVVRISDDRLNTFIRSKNVIFQNFSFQFNDNEIIVSGQDGDVRMRVKGNYQIEKEPVEQIAFRIEELQYNDLTMEKSLSRSLENDYGLAIDPKKYGFSAQEVRTEPKQIVFQLKANLF